MFRRQFLFGLLLVPLALGSSQAFGADRTILDADTMKKVLRPPTDADGKWIDKVVKLVDKGKLPVDLVDSTFQWSRKKGKNRFQYFKRGLILRAAERGIVLKS